MTTIGGSSFANAATILDGQSSAPTPAANYAEGPDWPYHSAWWKFTPSETGEYDFDTNQTTGDADTVLKLYGASQQNELAYDDDGGNGLLSLLRYSLTAGTTYRVRVGLYSSGASAEQYVLRVKKYVPPPPFQPKGTQGADRWQTATVITELPFFSDPTPSDKMSESNLPPANMSRSAVWKYVATESGYLSFDALTSPLLDFTGPYDTYPGVQVQVWSDRDTGDGTCSTLEAAESYWYDEARSVWVYRGQKYLKMVTGRTYYIFLGRTSGDQVQYRLRVSAYGPSSGWVQPPDQKGNVFTPNEYNNTRNIKGAGAGQYNSYTQTNAFYQALSFLTGWQGRNGVQRSFGGPYPGNDANAIQYTWENARLVGSGTGYWWSPNNGVEWNGGPGSKPNLTGGVWGDDQGFTDYPVGYHFHTDSAQTYQGVYWRVWHSGQSVNLGELERVCGANGGQQTYIQTTLDEMGNPPAYDLEWDSTKGTLIDLEVAPDEDQSGGTGKTFGGQTLGVRWYARPLERRPAVSWGFSKDSWADRQGSWRTTTAGPETWAGSSTFLSSYTGGLSSWIKVPDSLINQARAIEAAETDSNKKAGLMLYCAPNGFDSDAKPGSMGAIGLSRDDYWLRRYQACAVRPTIRPARYRIIAYPSIPPAPPIEVQTGEGVIKINIGTEAAPVWTTGCCCGSAPGTLGVLKVNVGDSLAPAWVPVCCSQRSPGELGAMKINVGTEEAPEWIALCCSDRPPV